MLVTKENIEKISQLPPVVVLKKTIEKQQFPHSLLLYGYSTEVLSLSALYLTACLFNIDLNEKIPAHPDLFYLRPSNKMRQINVDSIRTLIKNLNQSPYQADKKVCIIQDAERLNINASNAFLKTLEEPPADSILFLLSKHPHALLDTIKSRCFSIYIPSETSPSLQQNPSWTHWLNTYTQWLTTPSTSLISPYPLILNFEQTLTTLLENKLTTENNENTNHAHLTQEEIEALHSKQEKELHISLFQDIQSVSKNTLIEKEQFSFLAKLNSILEKQAYLLNFNLNVLNALEIFLLNIIKLKKTSSSL